MSSNGDLNVEIGATLTKLDKALKEMSTKFDKAFSQTEKESGKASKKVDGLWSGALSNIAGYMAAAFSVQVIKQFATEAVELAAKAEGIEAAFKKLNNPNLLGQLRASTRGTVSDLELMRQAVRANNFQVPLEKLGSFFQFATQRSAQTGESVDYLVNSIIDGIGRKSTLVLDNLGISASRLQDEVKKTGDFGLASGKIIQEELAKAGDVATTTAQKIAKQNAELENQKRIIGEQLTPAYLELFKGINSFISGISQGDLSKLSKFLGTPVNFLPTRWPVSEMEKTNKQFDKLVYNMKVLVAQNDALKDGGNWMDDYWKSQKKGAEQTTIAYEDAVKAAEKIIELNRLASANQMGIYGNNGRINGPGATTLTIPKDAQEMADAYQLAADKIENLDEESRLFFETQALQMQNATLGAQMFGNALQNAFAQSLDEGANFTDTLGNMLEDLIKQLVAAALAAFALSAILSSLGLGGFGVVAGSSFKELFKGSFGGLTGFDLSGASSLGAGSGNTNRLNKVVVEGRIMGSDLVLSNERSELRRNRRRGF